MLEAIHVNDALLNTITVDYRFTGSGLAGNKFGNKKVVVTTN